MNLSINRGPSNSQTIFPPVAYPPPLPLLSLLPLAQRRRRPASRRRRRRPQSQPSTADHFPLPALSAATPVTIPSGALLFTATTRPAPVTFSVGTDAQPLSAAASPSHHWPGPHLYPVKAIGERWKQNPNSMVFHLKLLSVKFPIILLNLLILCCCMCEFKNN